MKYAYLEGHRLPARNGFIFTWLCSAAHKVQPETMINHITIALTWQRHKKHKENLSVRESFVSIFVQKQNWMFFIKYLQISKFKFSLTSLMSRLGTTVFMWLNWIWKLLRYSIFLSENFGQTADHVKSVRPSFQASLGALLSNHIKAISSSMVE